MVSGCTFHLRSWERRHDRHGKWLAAPPSPACPPAPTLGQTRPGWDARSAIFRPRRWAPVPSVTGLQHGGPPSQEGGSPTPGALAPSAWPPAPRDSDLSQSVRDSTFPRKFPCGTVYLISLELCVHVCGGFTSLLPERLYPPGDKALSTPTALALHLAQSRCSVTSGGVNKRTDKSPDRQKGPF